MSITLPSLEELLQNRTKKPITAILKRGTDLPSAFKPEKINSVIEKASEHSGKHYSKEEISEIAEEVMDELMTQEVYSHSKRSIPGVEDVQDAVINVFHKRNARELSRSVESLGIESSSSFPIFYELLSQKRLDPTGEFYAQHREQRSRVRERLVHTPALVDGFDSTDKQLGIHNVHNGTAHKFDSAKLLNLILEKTQGVQFADAQLAVKRIEEYLANRRTDKPVSQEEFTAIADASLMERGYDHSQVLGGRKLSITLDAIEQLIFSKSVENSNIKNNNPEAVNLGIAELALKEYAQKKVFDTDVSEAHKNGMIHLHDLGYVDRVYCSAHSVEYLKKYGLDRIVANLDAKSSPAKAPHVLNNHIHTFLAAIQSSYAGALGFPMLNTLYGPALLKQVEIVEGNQIIRNDKGEIIQKIPIRKKKETLEEMFEDKSIEFEETKRTKVLQSYTKKEMKQIAQNLIFGASQSAFSRGGQTLFIDFNIDLMTPPHVQEVPALFLGAEYHRTKKNDKGEWELIESVKTEPPRHSGVMVDRGHKDSKGKPVLEPSNQNGDVIQPNDNTVWMTYGNELVRKASQDFAEAIYEVALDGDKYSNMFNFPKIDVHVGKETFEDPRTMELLKKFCELTEKNDSTYFMFDRGDGMNVSQCCRLRERITDPAILKHPEKMRFCGFQNVSINLPRAAFEAKGNNLEEKLESALTEIDKAMVLALKGHTNKMKFIQKLFDTEGSPLYTMGGMQSDDGEPYIDLKKSTYIIGIVGLNEFVQSLTGKQIHETPEAFLTGLRTISHMYTLKSEFTKKYGMKFVIEETPGESTNRRMAQIDLARYGEKAREVVKGDKGREYYTNSSHITADAEISGLDRAILQGKMNPMIEAGAITHIFSGERENKANAVYDFVKAIYDNTQSSQVVFSGEHTICSSCGMHVRGLHNKCRNCGNEDPKRITQKTRVVGYFSDPRSWNKSKQSEREARSRTQDYYAGNNSSLFDLEADLLNYIGKDRIKIPVIGKKDCSICDLAMDRVNRFVSKLPEDIRSKVDIEKYDVTTEQGRIMAAVYDAPIDTYPTIIIHQGDKFERKGWDYPYNKPATDVNTRDIQKMFSSVTGYSPK